TPSDVLRVTAMTLMNAMGGASGALYGTLFLQASAAVKGQATLGVVDFAAMWQAGLNGVIERGKAELGGKTMIDALQPAFDALKIANDEDQSLADALAAAADAAQQGADATAEMVAQYGRAKFTGERSRGQVDAGAASMAVMFKAMWDYWRGQEDGET
ncbi:MAG: dihydroxyacetone kinase subunit L, partial [Chloroflexi bacterium]